MKNAKDCKVGEGDVEERDEWFCIALAATAIVTVLIVALTA